MEKDKIRSILDNHPKLDYIQKCFRNMNKKKFVEDVLELNKNPMIVKFENLGTLHQDKNILLFENHDEFAGFFALYRFMLNALYFSEKFHLIPVINYTKCIYYEKKLSGFSNNPFEYYFNQVSNITVEEVYSSSNIVRCSMANRELAEQLNKSEGRIGYRVSEKYIKNMGKVSKKFIKLNLTVEPIIRNSIKNILNGKKTIGVHIRGTDFKLNFNGHPVATMPSDYIKYIQEAISNYQFEQVFLATDELTTIKLFEKTFGDKLVYYNDVMRTDGNISVAFSDSQRINHHYLLGLEVLKDMHTLASCDGLIAGMSQVSICARITKSANEKEYEYLEILDKGLNNTNHSTKDYNKFHHTKH